MPQATVKRSKHRLDRKIYRKGDKIDVPESYLKHGHPMYDRFQSVNQSQSQNRFKKGDRIVQVIDGEPFEGTVSSVSAQRGVHVHFDDGDKKYVDPTLIAHTEKKSGEGRDDGEGDE